MRSLPIHPGFRSSFPRTHLLATASARLILAVLLPLLGLGASSPFAGFYTGYVYLSMSGSVSVPETAVGAAAFTIDSNGAITGSLNGTVDAAGAILWATNSSGFTEGTVTGPVIGSLVHKDNSGATTTLRLAATNTAGGFGDGGGVAQSLVWRQPTPTGAGLRGIVFGGGRFVAVGQAGAVVTSPDGTNWLSSNATTTKELVSVAYGNGTYVAVGVSATVVASPDGVVWSPRTMNSSPFQNFVGVAYGNNVFVAVNLVNEVFTSADGNAWTKVSNASVAGFWNALRFVGGRFVLVGGKNESGRISTSENGVTWTAESTPAVPGSGITDVTFNQGTWFAVGAGGTKVIRFTTPAATDTIVSDATGLGSTIAFHNGLLVAGGRQYSTDGITWKRDSYPTAQVRSFASANGVLVAIGATLTTTLNGKLWANATRVVPSLAVNNVGPNGPVTGPILDEIEYYTALGLRRTIRLGIGGLLDERANNLSPYTNVFSPTTKTLRDGISLLNGSVVVGDDATILRFGTGQNAWTNVSVASSAHLLSVATADQQNLVAVGTGGTILHSANGGLSWAASISGTANTLNRVTYAGATGFNYWVAVGDGGIIRKSTDGTTWASLNSGTTKRLVGIASRGAGTIKLVAVAEDSTVLVSDNHGQTWTALTINAPYPMLWNDGATAYGADGFQMTAPDNGTNWSYSLPLVGSFAGIGYGNGRYVALAGQARVSSTDLDHWTAAPSTYGHNAVTFGAGLLVSVGAGSQYEPRGYVSTSVEGAKWIDRTTPTQASLNAITYALGRFVAVGDASTVINSVDGVNWSNRTLPGGGGALRGVTFGKGLFTAVGQGGILRTSGDGDIWTNAPGTGANLNSVAFANGLFVAVGDNGAIRTSTNGVAWTARAATPSTSVTFWTVRYAGGRFIGVGNLDSSGDGAVLVHSIDGTNWVKEITHVANALRASVTAAGRFVAVGDNGSVASAPVQDSESPQLTAQPLPLAQTMATGTRVELAGDARGTGLRFQWFLDGNPLQNGPGVSGATSGTLVLNSVDVLNTGRYVLSAWNDAGSVSTEAVTLTVNGPPVILSAPTPATVGIGGSTNFTVVAVGPGTLTYEWRRNGISLVEGGAFSGTRTARLAISGITADLESSYDVIVSNAFGHITPQAAAKLTVNRPPTFVVAPQPLSVNEGESITLTATLDGTLPIAFQWRRNGVVIANTDRISGATNLTLTVTGAQVADAGSYTLTATNAFGPAVTSVPAFVSVLGPGAFHPGFTFNGSAAFFDIAPTSDGRFLIAGDGYVTLGAQSWQRLIKINLDGSLVTTFATTNIARTPNNTVRTIAVQADGSILAGGGFFQWGGNSSYAYAVRLNADGVLDTSFTPGPNLTVKRILSLADGRLLMGRTGLGFATSKVTRYTQSGAVDSSFTEVVNANRELHGLALQRNGTIWTSGVFGLKKADSNGANPVAVATYAPFPEMYKVFVGPDDKIYYSDNNGQYFGRLNADGTRDTTFIATINGHVEDMTFLADGRLLVAGSFQTVNSVTNAYLTLLEGTGKVSTSFTSPYTWVAGNSLNRALLLSDGSALVAGTVQITQPTSQRFLQRIQVLPHQAPPTGQTYADWKASVGLPPGKDGPDDDADGDGLSNLAEFALGTPPLQAQSRGLPQGTLTTVSGELYPSLTLIRRRNVAGASLVVEAFSSIPFDAGSSVPFVQVGDPVDLGDGTEQVVVRAQTPLRSLQQYFFRTRVSSP